MYSDGNTYLQVAQPLQDFAGRFSSRMKWTGAFFGLQSKESGFRLVDMVLGYYSFSKRLFVASFSEPRVNPSITRDNDATEDLPRR